MFSSIPKASRMLNTVASSIRSLAFSNRLIAGALTRAMAAGAAA